MAAPDWPQIVTWGIVFVGWITVHYAALNRDRRKEKRETSVKVCSNLVALQDDAIDFHTASHCDVRKSTDIAQQVEQILLQIQRAPMVELDISLARRVALRQSITRQNIDPSDFSPQTADSSIILDIRSAVSEIIAVIEEAREIKWK